MYTKKQNYSQGQYKPHISNWRLTPFRRIVDDHYEHALRLFQDKDTGAVRLQASAQTGALKRYGEKPPPLPTDRRSADSTTGRQSGQPSSPIRYSRPRGCPCQDTVLEWCTSRIYNDSSSRRNTIRRGLRAGSMSSLLSGLAVLIFPSLFFERLCTG